MRSLSQFACDESIIVRKRSRLTLRATTTTFAFGLIERGIGATELSNHDGA